MKKQLKKKTKKQSLEENANKKKPSTRRTLPGNDQAEMRVLILEDNPVDAELIEHELKKAGSEFVAKRVETRTAFVDALKTFRPDLILADYSLPRFDAISALTLARKQIPFIPFIVVTGSIGEEKAAACLRSGADDYLLKDRLGRLGEAVKQASKKFRLQAEKITAEKKSLASELLYRTFIDSSTDMSFLKDGKFRHLIANRALCRFYGKTEAEIHGKTDYELMDRAAATRCRKSDRQALKNRKIIIQEETVGKRTFETRKFPVRLIDGSVGVGGYIRDISERKQTQEQIEQSSRKWVATFDAIRDGIVLLSTDQTIMKANQAFADLVGKPFTKIIGKKCYDLVHPDKQPDAQCPFQKMLKSKNREAMELAIHDRVFEVIVDPIVQESGTKLGAVHIFTDITSRKQSEAQVLTSLREKEVLLQEIHHRVKNNLQIISGLLTLQVTQTNDERLQQMIKESQSRIWTMALIHQTLYQSGNLAAIDMADYIRNLCANLLSSYAQVAMPPTIVFDLVTIRLVIDKAIPLALIINELVTNAIKHAFADRRPGEIRISLQKCRGVKFYAPTYELTIADNGVGLPRGFDPKNQKSLGLQLVAMLTKQLGGSFATASEAGAVFRVVFNANEKKE